MAIHLLKPASAESASQSASSALPGFGRLAGGACGAGAVPVALLMLGKQIGIAGGVALGVAISLGVCGLLFLFVERVMPFFVGTVRSDRGAAHGSQLQFLLLLAAKLVFIALVGGAFLTWHSINPVAVLCGFVTGQTTMVLLALGFRRH